VPDVRVEAIGLAVSARSGSGGESLLGFIGRAPRDPVIFPLVQPLLTATFVQPLRTCLPGAQLDDATTYLSSGGGRGRCALCRQCVSSFFGMQLIDPGCERIALVTQCLQGGVLARQRSWSGSAGRPLSSCWPEYFGLEAHSRRQIAALFEFSMPALERVRSGTPSLRC
jgi:hypothetical protein